MNNEQNSAYRTNWAFKIARYIGLTSATGKGSKGYHVTRRYTLIPKRKNVKGASNTLIDVELFTLDMKFRLFNIKLGKLEDKNFGGILDIAFMRPKQIGYNVAKINLTRGAEFTYPNDNRNISYRKTYKYLQIPTKHYLIEDIYLMQKIGLRPDPAKKEKNRKRMVLLAREMSKKKILYEGKAKTILEGPTPDTVIQYFKDDATANNAEKHSIINGKGVLNNSISDFLMKRINEIGIPTHYIKKLNMREQLVRKVEIIPVEFVVRNIAAGSIVKRLGLKEGKIFSRPLIEHYLKKDELGDPLINEDHIINFEWGTRDELDEMNEYGLRINDFLRGLFWGIGLKLIDFKIEFGRYYSEDGNSILLLADEISPDNCRLWDVKTNHKMDKDLFRQDIGGLKEAYQEVADRLGILPEKKKYSNAKTEIVK